MFIQIIICSSVIFILAGVLQKFHENLEHDIEQETYMYDYIYPSLWEADSDSDSDSY